VLVRSRGSLSDELYQNFIALIERLRRAHAQLARMRTRHRQEWGEALTEFKRLRAEAEQLSDGWDLLERIYTERRPDL
jgi:hypothetical protein